MFLYSFLNEKQESKKNGRFVDFEAEQEVNHWAFSDLGGITLYLYLYL